MLVLVFVYVCLGGLASFLVSSAPRQALAICLVPNPDFPRSKPLRSGLTPLPPRAVLAAKLRPVSAVSMWETDPDWGSLNLAKAFHRGASRIRRVCWTSSSRESATLAPGSRKKPSGAIARTPTCPCRRASGYGAVASTRPSRVCQTVAVALWLGVTRLEPSSGQDEAPETFDEALWDSNWSLFLSRFKGWNIMAGLCLEAESAVLGDQRMACWGSTLRMRWLGGRSNLKVTLATCHLWIHHYYCS